MKNLLKLVTSSESEDFDELARKAIAAAAPYPVFNEVEEVKFSVESEARKKDMGILKKSP